MLFPLLLPILTKCGPVDWLLTDVEISKSGHQYVERQSAPRYQVGLGIDFPVPVQVIGFFKINRKFSNYKIQLKEAVNNVAIEQHNGRIYMGVRTSKNHFASNQTELIITSADLADSGIDGLTFEWVHELTISTRARQEIYFLRKLF